MNRHERRKAESVAKIPKADGPPTPCLACGINFPSQRRFREHVSRDHHIPDGHLIYDFDRVLYDVTEIDTVALLNAPKFGPFLIPLDERTMWGLSMAQIHEGRLETMTPMELRRPVLAVDHSSLGYVRFIDGHHRMTKLHRLGSREVEAYVVPEGEVEPFIQRRRPNP
ncbi:MAG TPA: hypothetical protein VNT30_01065 [Stellaceae bacterium]|nr:hypothetical protein [Stellaceae bacterium]